MKIKPLHDRVLIKRLEKEEEVRGGIIIPDTAKEKPMEGEIIAVGPGRVLDDGNVRPVAVKVGDKVLVGKYSGAEIRLGDEEYLFVREDEILAVLK